MAKTISSSEKSRLPANISPDLVSAQPDDNQAIATSSWQIVHVTAGRVRLRTTNSDVTAILDTIAQDLRKQDGVKDVSVNQQMGSLVVSFDENKLSLPQVLALHPSLPIYQPQVVSNSASQIDPFASWKSWDFWKEQSISLIPLMMGLAVTRGFGIQGWVSIPAYMIAADTTRGVIGFISSQAASAAMKSHTIDEPQLAKVGDKLTIPHQSAVSDVGKAGDMTARSERISYSVVHTMPGRIRLKIAKINQDYAYGKRLEKLLKTDAHVKNVRVNMDAASVAIAYQPAEIPLSHWVSLMELALETNPPTQSIATANQPVLEPISQTAEIAEATTVNETSHLTETAEVINAITTDDNTSELSSIWANLKPPAMSFSLGIMANIALDTMY